MKKSSMYHNNLLNINTLTKHFEYGCWNDELSFQAGIYRHFLKYWLSDIGFGKIYRVKNLYFAFFSEIALLVTARTNQNQIPVIENQLNLTDMPSLFLSPNSYPVWHMCRFPKENEMQGLYVKVTRYATKSRPPARFPQYRFSKVFFLNGVSDRATLA